MDSAKITWTKVDEAPALATHSLLPVVKAFTNAAGVNVETRDISLASRIMATFPEYLTGEQKVNDDLAFLGELVKKPEANIIKLPNISASIPQLKAAIAKYLDNGRSPSRKAGELDNRGSHMYLAQYWAEQLAEQNESAELREKFTEVAAALKANEVKILEEIAAAEGKPTDIGGYYLPDDALATKAMRPSATMNAIIDGI